MGPKIQSQTIIFQPEVKLAFILGHIKAVINMLAKRHNVSLYFRDKQVFITAPEGFRVLASIEELVLDDTSCSQDVITIYNIDKKYSG